MKLIVPSPLQEIAAISSNGLLHFLNIEHLRKVCFFYRRFHLETLWKTLSLIGLPSWTLSMIRILEFQTWGSVYVWYALVNVALIFFDLSNVVFTVALVFFIRSKQDVIKFQKRQLLNQAIFAKSILFSIGWMKCCLLSDGNNPSTSLPRECMFGPG